MLRAFLAGIKKPGFKPLLKQFWADLKRDITPNRIRRFGQALVLVHEWPDNGEWLHAHFIHTPASVTGYASIMTGIPWTCSAHAQGYLDLAGLGAVGKARPRPLDSDVHPQRL